MACPAPSRWPTLLATLYSRVRGYLGVNLSPWTAVKSLGESKEPLRVRANVTMKSPPLLGSWEKQPFCSAPLSQGQIPPPKVSKAPNLGPFIWSPLIHQTVDCPQAMSGGGAPLGSTGPAPSHTPVLGVGAVSSSSSLPPPLEGYPLWSLHHSSVTLLSTTSGDVAWGK